MVAGRLLPEGLAAGLGPWCSAGMRPVEGGAALDGKHSINRFPVSGHSSPYLQSVPGKVPLSPQDGKSKFCQSISYCWEPLTLLCRDQTFHGLAAQKDAVAQKMHSLTNVFCFLFDFFFFLQICVYVRKVCFPGLAL